METRLVLTSAVKVALVAEVAVLEQLLHYREQGAMARVQAAEEAAERQVAAEAVPLVVLLSVGKGASACKTYTVTIPK